jgi:BlaI family transcriptional regulator, penicillinase repressor
MRRLTDTEWILLKALWGREPQTLGSIIQTIRQGQPEVDWNYKTYHTYLRAMCEKGLAVCEVKNARDNFYSPGITREEALQAESKSLINRISGGSVGELVAMMAQSGQLTERDQKELMELAQRLDSENRKRGE